MHDNMTDSTHHYQIAALYLFTPLSDLEELRARLQAWADEHALLGSLLIAKEGINGTIAGQPASLEAFLKTLRQLPGLETLNWKISWHPRAPFKRMKVKIKAEIVSMGQGELDVANCTGRKVSPQEWDALLDDPDCLVIDTRNQYEIDIGSFKNALNPKTDNFRQFSDYIKTLDSQKHRKVAMFCTGGIRCEKASAYMKKKGFSEVLQLDGGILNYLASKPDNHHWQGDCFIFDERVALTKNLTASHYQQCFACRHPLSPDALQHPHYREGISCHFCYHSTSGKQKNRYADRQRQLQSQSG